MKFTLATIVGIATSASAFTPSAFLGKTSISKNAIKSTSALDMKYKVAVVGGGPSGACAAEIFAQEKGIDTVLFERKLDNAKPCGGAIPLCMVGEFDIPESVVDRKVRIPNHDEAFLLVTSSQRCGVVHFVAMPREDLLAIDCLSWSNLSHIPPGTGILHLFQPS